MNASVQQLLTARLVAIWHTVYGEVAGRLKRGC